MDSEWVSRNSCSSVSALPKGLSQPTLWIPGGCSASPKRHFGNSGRLRRLLLAFIGQELEFQMFHADNKPLQSHLCLESNCNVFINSKVFLQNFNISWLFQECNCHVNQGEGSTSFHLKHYSVLSTALKNRH